MSINEMFVNEQNESTNARALSGTAELTSIASKAANHIIQSMEADINTWRERLKKSTTDTKELDAIIAELRPEIDIDEDNQLRNLDEDTVEGILKSQQSKRSRAKSKAMTLDNYRTLLTAAIAETIIRELYDKPKLSVGGFRSSGIVDYTPAQLEQLAEDQEALRKEIRNLQSKKSIMKSKADFSESDERWQALLKAEIMLKDLRVGGRSTSYVEVDSTKNKLVEMLDGIDTEHLKAADSKDLLNAIKEMLQ